MYDEDKELVEMYLKRKKNTSDLIFIDQVNGNEIKVTYYDLPSLVYEVLTCTKYFSSVSAVTKNVETIPNKWRSSFDIWRHCKYYMPDLKLYEVMETLFEIQDLLAGHFCPDIGKRVFKTKKNTCSDLVDELVTDEYGLIFDFWK